MQTKYFLSHKAPPFLNALEVNLLSKVAFSVTSNISIYVVANPFTIKKLFHIMIVISLNGLISYLSFITAFQQRRTRSGEDRALDRQSL